MNQDRLHCRRYHQDEGGSPRIATAITSVIVPEIGACRCSILGPKFGGSDHVWNIDIAFIALSPRWPSVLVEFSPSKMATASSARSSICKALPHVSPSGSAGLLNASQHALHPTLATRRILWLHEVFQVSVGHVQSLAACNWMWVDCSCGQDAVLPLFLHLCVHNQQRVVRKMYCNLALFVCESFVVLGDYATDAKLAGHSLCGVSSLLNAPAG